MLENQFLDINKKDSKGINSFWIAANYGHGGVMKLLAEAGIDIFCTDGIGNNALHIASSKNFLNVVKMLI